MVKSSEEYSRTCRKINAFKISIIRGKLELRQKLRVRINMKG